MRAVVQRVKSSSVTVNGVVTGEIGNGLNVLLGIEAEDTIDDVDYMAEKIVNLRIFEDDNDKMNLSLLDTGGEMLVISQFTLLGDCRKGRRPDFTAAARPDYANDLYIRFIKCCRDRGINVEEGVFRAHMHVKIDNDGPVTLIVDSRRKF